MSQEILKWLREEFDEFPVGMDTPATYYAKQFLLKKIKDIEKELKDEAEKKEDGNRLTIAEILVQLNNPSHRALCIGGGQILKKDGGADLEEMQEQMQDISENLDDLRSDNRIMQEQIRDLQLCVHALHNAGAGMVWSNIASKEKFYACLKRIVNAYQEE